MATQERLFTDEEAAALNKLMLECFDYCDPCAVSMEYIEHGRYLAVMKETKENLPFGHDENSNYVSELNTCIDILENQLSIQ